jgi:hypothetical protein
MDVEKISGCQLRVDEQILLFCFSGMQAMVKQYFSAYHVY